MQRQRSIKKLVNNVSLATTLLTLQVDLDQGRISEFIKSFLQLIETSAEKFPKEFQDRFIKKDLIQLAIRASSSCFVMGNKNSVPLLNFALEQLSAVGPRDQLYFRVKAISDNNLTVFNAKYDANFDSVDSFKRNIKHSKIQDPYLTAIFRNNLAVSYLNAGNFEDAYKQSIESLKLIRDEILKLIDLLPPEISGDDQQLKKKISILSITAINIGICVEKLPKLNSKNQSIDSFYREYYSLAKTFLGDNHILTKRLENKYAKTDTVLSEEIIEIKSVRSTSTHQITNRKTPTSKKALNEILDDFQSKKMHKGFSSSSNSLTSSTSTTSMKPVLTKHPLSVKHAKSKSLQKEFIIRHPQSSAKTTPTTDEASQKFYTQDFMSTPKMHIKIPEPSDSESIHPLVSTNTGADSTPKRSTTPKVKLVQRLVQSDQYIPQVRKIKTTKASDEVDIGASLQNIINQQKVFQESLIQKIENAFKKALPNGETTFKSISRISSTNNTFDNRANEMESNLKQLKGYKFKKPSLNPEDSDEIKEDIQQPNNTPVQSITDHKFESAKSSTQNSKAPTPTHFQQPQVNLTRHSQSQPLIKQPIPSQPIEKKPIASHTRSSSITQQSSSSQPQAYSQQPQPQTQPPSQTSAQTQNQSQASIQKNGQASKESGSQVSVDAASPKTQIVNRAALFRLEQDLRKVPIQEITDEETATNSEIMSNSKFQKLERSSSIFAADKISKLIDDPSTTSTGFSLTIPNSLESLESSLVAGNGIAYQRAVVKKRIVFDGNVSYVIVCRGSLTKSEKKFVLQLLNSNEKSILYEQEIPIKEVKSILEKYSFRDVMPAYFQVKHIRNCSQLMQALFMPFVSVTKISKAPSFKVEFNPAANGLLNTKVVFLQNEVLVTLHHIQGSSFRIVINNIKNEKNTLRIDFELDQETLTEDFLFLNDLEQKSTPVQNIVKIIEGFEADDDGESLLQAADIIRALSPRIEDKTSRTFQEYYTPSNPQQMELIIKSALKDIEACLKEQLFDPINNHEHASTPFYLQLRTHQTLKKLSFYTILEDSELSSIKIYLKNFFDTHAPKKSTVKARGEQILEIDSLWKHFGLNYSSLDVNDKISILSMIPDMFILDTFDKVLQEDDYDRFDNNPIHFIPLEIGTYHRTFLGEKYKFPMTMNLIGTANKPLGVQIKVFNPNELIETGVFLRLNSSFWIKTEADKKKTKAKKYGNIGQIDDYHIESVLKYVGWQIIKESLHFDLNPNKPSIVGIKIVKGLTIIDILENHVNLESIAKFYQNNVQT